MNAFRKTTTLSFLLCSAVAASQDYPYEEAAPKGTPVKNKSSLPVESPEELEKAGRFQKRTSIFRMSLKAGGNYSYIQSDYGNINGFGAEGRLAFGWDLAFQPVYLETEIGYRGMNLTTDFPVHVIVAQQGLYYRERIGKTSLWKPGIVTTLDFRIESIDAFTRSYSLLPSFGITSLWEIDPILIQVTAYLHRVSSGQNFLSTTFLTGLKF